MLEFFEIVAVVVYLLCALVTGILAWFERENVKLLVPCFAFLAIGMAPVPTWVSILMPFLVVTTLLSFRKKKANLGFDYQKHLLALLDNGTLSQKQYEEESSRIRNR